MAPPATAKGFSAALRAMVERKDLSPISAAKTSEKVCRRRARVVACESFLVEETSSTVFSASAFSSSMPEESFGSSLQRGSHLHAPSRRY